ncbi:MAG: PrgI family protein [Candidatus Methanomethylicia archaeon]|nr:PrgI family protein [Candidatus Methanomethylicia archaeon]
MVRVVRTLWFETISILSNPLIETPIGMITIRQGLLVGAGALVGVIVYRAIPPFVDPFVRIGFGLIPFALFAMTAAKKVKTVPPEQYLLLLLRPKRATRVKAKAEAKTKGKAKAEVRGRSEGARGREEEAAAPQPEVALELEEGAAAPPAPAETVAAASPHPEPVRLRAVEEVPEEVRRTLRTFMPPLKAVSAVMGEGGEVIVSDVLRNPKTGAPLLNTKLYASVGTRIITATSDERGAYTIKFYPSAPGSYYVLVAVQGFGTPVDSMLVNVARRD